MTTPQHPSAGTATAMLVAAFACAAAASALLWFGSAALRGERIDLESVLPLVGDSVTGPGSGGSTSSGTAGLVLLGVALVAGLPLLARGATRRAVGTGATLAITAFALVTFTRNGIFYLPAAGLLWFATGRPVPGRRPRSPVPPPSRPRRSWPVR